jgi:hypothetical protein
MDPNDPKNKADAAQKKEEAEKADAEALTDPAKEEPPVQPKPKFNTRPVGPGEGPCEQALQTAREILGEIQRTGWRSPDCQSLFAKMKACPDPALIYVDPDSGYWLGSAIPVALL